MRNLSWLNRFRELLANESMDIEEIEALLETTSSFADAEYAISFLGLNKAVEYIEKDELNKAQRLIEVSLYACELLDRRQESFDQSTVIRLENLQLRALYTKVIISLRQDAEIKQVEQSLTEFQRFISTRVPPLEKVEEISQKMRQKLKETPKNLHPNHLLEIRNLRRIKFLVRFYSKLYEEVSYVQLSKVSPYIKSILPEPAHIQKICDIIP